jgi:hypothetical protein
VLESGSKPPCCQSVCIALSSVVIASLANVDFCVICPSPLQKTDDAMVSEQSHHQFFTMEMQYHCRVYPFPIAARAWKIGAQRVVDQSIGEHWSLYPMMHRGPTVIIIIKA